MNRLFAHLFWAALLFCPLALLFEYYSGMWNLSEYRFFPLLGLAAGFLISQSWDRLGRAPSKIGWLLVSLGMLLISLATLKWSPWLGNLGWVLLLGAWLHSHSSPKHELFSVWCLTWLLVRAPANLDLTFSAYLQKKTASLSSIVLDWLGVAHFRSGNVLELQNGPLFVEEACSGVQSLFAVLFVATAIVIWLKRPLFALPVYWLAGIWWAVVMNLLRVVAIAWSQEVLEVDAASGWRHGLVGYASLVCAILLLLSTDRLLRVFFYPVPDRSTSYFNPLSRIWNSAVGYTGALNPIEHQGGLGALVASIILMIVSLGLFTGQLIFKPSVLEHSGLAPNRIWFAPPDAISAEKMELPVLAFENISNSSDETIGVNADVWQIQLRGERAKLAVSQPYPEFHDLAVCYEAIGWKETDRSVLGSGAPDEWQYISSSFARGEQRGFLVTCGMNRQGEIVNPTDSSIASLLEARLSSWVSVPSRNNVLMIQLWIESSSEIDPEIQVIAVQAFLRGRSYVREALISK